MKCLFIIVLLIATILTSGCASHIPALPFGPVTIEAEFGSAYSDAQREVTVYSTQKNVSHTSVFYNVSSTKEAGGGNTFVIIDAQIKNIGADSITVFPHDFSIVDSDGNRYEKQPYYGEDRLAAGELKKNQHKRGIMLFEVPQNAKKLLLNYKLNGKFIAWKIN